VSRAVIRERDFDLDRLPRQRLGRVVEVDRQLVADRQHLKPAGRPQGRRHYGRQAEASVQEVETIKVEELAE